MHLTPPPLHTSSARPPPLRDLNLEFEVPFRELGFHGVPHRTNSFIMPTVNCLVELTEMPFTVLTLSGAAHALGLCSRQRSDGGSGGGAQR